MYCTKCGAKLREGAKFCHSCGQPVRAANHAIDMAKAGVKQVLAALKDSDVTAPATAGEISCKAEPAQNAFLKLLKKGLLCLVPVLLLSIGTNAQTVFFALEDSDNYKKDTEKGLNAKSPCIKI